MIKCYAVGRSNRIMEAEKCSCGVLIYESKELLENKLTNKQGNRKTGLDYCLYYNSEWFAINKANSFLFNVHMARKLILFVFSNGELNARIFYFVIYLICLIEIYYSPDLLECNM